MTIAALMVLLVGFFGVAGLVLVLRVLVLRLREAERHRLERQDGYPVVERIDVLQDEISHLQTEISRLTERLDFTEKLLMSGDDPEPDTSEETRS